MSSLRVLAALMLLPSVASATGWWDGDWRYRQRVAPGSAALAPVAGGFPLRVRLTDDVFARALAQPGGTDLRAVDARGRELDLEVVAWTEDEVILQVGLPDAATVATDGFHLYFGNPHAAKASARGLWGDPYLAVLHLSGDVRNVAHRAAGVERAGFVAQNGVTPGLITGRNERWISFNRDYRGFVGVSPEPAEDTAGFAAGVRFRPHGTPRMTVLAGAGFELFTEENRLVLRGRAGEEDLVFENVAVNGWHAAVVACDFATGRRTLHLDDRPAATGVLAGRSTARRDFRLGRGMADDAPFQFGGDLEAFRLLDGVPGAAWLRAFSANLADQPAFLAVGALEQADGTPPLPPPPQPVVPVDHARSYKPAGMTLRWRPAAGATSYQVLLFADAAGRQPLATLAADTSCQRALTRAEAGAAEVYWTIAAVSPHGTTRAPALRRLTFVEGPPASGAAVAPELQSPDHLTLELRGYLGARVDRLATYLVDFPARNPGLLRMLRERPEPVIPSWAGVFPGQYLSSAQLMWRLTGRADLAERARNYTRDLIATQRADGYLAPFDNIRGDLALWSHYAVLIGLLDHHADTGSPEALAAARRIADLVVTTYGPLGEELPKAGGSNEAISHAFARLYAATHDPRYLAFVRYVMDEVWNEPGGVAFLHLARRQAPLAEFPVRRWEGVHNLQALPALYWATGEPELRDAFVQLWHRLRETERHTTGGFSTNEGLLGTRYNRGTIETCCTVAWTLLTTDLLRLTGDSTAADELEWSTFNSALGSIPYDGTCSTYGTQPDGLRQFHVLRQGPPDGIELNCCSTNAARALGNLAAWALLRQDDGLVLNFYGPSLLAADLPSGNRVTLEQATAYPSSGRIQLRVEPHDAETFTLRLRIPGWSAQTALSVNGVAQPAPASGTYAVLHRRWAPGDTVTLDLDFTPRFDRGREDYAGKVAIFRGPLLLASDARYTNDRKPYALPVATAGLTIEALEPPPGPGPWVLARVTDGEGRQFTVCDFSSAGLFADPYRSWFELESPPSPP
jgi:DUF1680 family protein